VKLVYWKKKRRKNKKSKGNIIDFYLAKIAQNNRSMLADSTPSRARATPPSVVKTPMI
jgi:hypothetical protein